MKKLKGIIVVADNGNEWIPASAGQSVFMLTRLVIAGYIERIANVIRGEQR